MTAATDLLSIDDAMENLSGLGAAERDRVGGYVTAISAAIDDLCGPVVARAAVEVLNVYGSYLMPLGPVRTVTQVRERSSVGGTWRTLAGTEFEVVGNVIHRVSSTWPQGDALVEVTYSRGRCADTATVSEQFKAAARRFVQHVWRNAEGAGSELGAIPTGTSGFAVPNFVRELLLGQIRTGLA